MEHKGRTNLYSPLISRRDYLASETRSFLNRLYGGSMSAFAVSLCDSGISKEDPELSCDEIVCENMDALAGSLETGFRDWGQGFAAEDGVLRPGTGFYGLLSLDISSMITQ